jgi:hypothetical protein
MTDTFLHLGGWNLMSVHNGSIGEQATRPITRNLGWYRRAFFSRSAVSMFLFGATFLSALPYLSGLGFYSDDWAYQATLAPVSGQSLTAMLKALGASDSNLIIRPVQAILLALEFKAFGRHAFHITSSPRRFSGSSPFFYFSFWKNW